MGGAPANVACALSKLKIDSIFVGCLGNDNFGKIDHIAKFENFENELKTIVKKFNIKIEYNNHNVNNDTNYDKANKKHSELIQIKI